MLKNTFNKAMPKATGAYSRLGAYFTKNILGGAYLTL